MMDTMRKNTKTILIILVLAFIGTIVFDWGMNYMGSGSQQRGIVGSIAGRDISYDEYFRIIQNEYARLKESNDSEPTISEMKELRDQVWNQLVNEILVGKEIEKRGITVSDDEVLFILHNNPPSVIISNPVFQTDDKFDYQKYTQALSNPELNWIDAENYVRATHSVSKMNTLILSTVRVTEQEIKQEFTLKNQTANARYLYIGPEHFSKTQVTVTDTEIQNYYDSHQDEFTIPAQRKMNYVLFSTEATKADTEMVYEQINMIIERAKSGEDFAELAKEYSEGPTGPEGGNLGYFQEGDMIEPFEKAAFAAEAGDIVGPVETSFGLHIIKVFDKKKTRGKIDSVKASHILLKLDASETTIDNASLDASYFVQDARDMGFAEAAQQISLEVKETPFFQESGFIPGFGMQEEISYFAFTSEPGDISSSIETARGFVIFELSEIQDATIQSLDEVKETIQEILSQQKQKQLAGEYAAQLSEKIKSGKSIEAIASEDSLELKETGPFTFEDYISNIGRDYKFAGAALRLNQGEISTPVESARGYYIIELLEKDEIDPSEYELQKPDIEQQLLIQKQQCALVEWMMKLRENTKIEDYREDFFR